MSMKLEIQRKIWLNDAVFYRIGKENISHILRCLGDGNEKRVKVKDRAAVNKYFAAGWLGYGCWCQTSNPIVNPQTGEYTSEKIELIGYCFIKTPRSRPETMTVVRSDFRNLGVATRLRNVAIENRRFKGHVIYSAVKIDNPASFKSVLKSGFTVFDFTKDGFIQLMKVLPYHSDN